MVRWVVAFIGCVACGGPSVDEPVPDAPVSDVVTPPEPRAPRLRRLTGGEIRHALQGVFGPWLMLELPLEPDVVVDGLEHVGAAEMSPSALGVEQLETLALSVAAQAVHQPTIRASWFTCAPEGPADAACLRAILEPVVGGLWRRPATADELDRLVEVGQAAARAAESFDLGAEVALVAAIQSPRFAWRVELGEDDGAGRRVYTSSEQAQRLAWAIWDGPPDDVLRAAAADDTLRDPAVRAHQVARMMAHPDAWWGMRALGDEALRLRRVLEARKGPHPRVAWTQGLATDAREESMSFFAGLALTAGADLRDLVTSRDTVVSSELGRFYGVEMPEGAVAERISYGEDSGRLGLLGQVSFLAAHANASETSPTRRGRFVREILLCDPIDPPPPGTNTTLPAPDANAETVRDRLAAHDLPGCHDCHAQMDPIGLAMEAFDAVGWPVEIEDREEIDVRGDLDGTSVDGLEDLAWVLRDDPRFSRCLVETTWAWALGWRPTVDDAPGVDAVTSAFEASGGSMTALFQALVQTDAFHAAGPLDEEAP